LRFKGFVSRIVLGIETRLKRTVLVNWRLISFFVLNSTRKATPTQEKLKTNFSSLRITTGKMAFSGYIEINSPVVFKTAEIDLA
jgi:hypothetical protein